MSAFHDVSCTFAPLQHQLLVPVGLRLRAGPRRAQRDAPSKSRETARRSPLPAQFAAYAYTHRSRAPLPPESLRSCGPRHFPEMGSTTAFFDTLGGRGELHKPARASGRARRASGGRTGPNSPPTAGGI